MYSSFRHIILTLTILSMLCLNISHFPIEISTLITHLVFYEPNYVLDKHFVSYLLILSEVKQASAAHSSDYARLSAFNVGEHFSLSQIRNFEHFCR